MTSSTSSYTAFTHIRLFGPVAVKAYPFGPVAVRIEHATITIGDAKAAFSIAAAALMFEDMAKQLAPTRVGRSIPKTVDTQIAILIAVAGTQKISNIAITPAHAAYDRCGTAAITIGVLRITAGDRDAAQAVSKGLADAYNEARYVFTKLPTFEQLTQARDRRRAANKKRRRPNQTVSG